MPKIELEMGDQLIIDKSNADAWVQVIGEPLANELKKAPASNTNPVNFIVTYVDHQNRVITIAKILP